MVTIIKMQRLTEKVVDVLTEQVLTGYYVPGQLLPTQKELSEQMGVSLTVIREALKILHDKGLVRIHHGVGSFVNETPINKASESLLLVARLNKATLTHWLEARKIVEVESAGLAAERRDEENLENIHLALLHMRAVCDEPAACLEADRAFHLQIAKATQNPSLVTLMHPILRPLEEAILHAVRDPQSVASALAEHDTIYLAIEKGDIDAAREAMHAHLARVRIEIEEFEDKG